MMFRAYQHARGMTEAELGEVAVAERAWASLNPDAIMREPISIADYLASAYICEPLRLFDYCLVNDGGVALIVAEAKRARRIARTRSYRSDTRQDANRSATSLEPRLTEFYLPAQQVAARRLFNAAGIAPADVDVVQIYDSSPFMSRSPWRAMAIAGSARPGASFGSTGSAPTASCPSTPAAGTCQRRTCRVEIIRLRAFANCAANAETAQVSNCRFVPLFPDVAGKATSILYGR